jgi:hypothetical protein
MVDVEVPQEGPEPADFRAVGAVVAVLAALWLTMNEISLLAAGFLAQGGSGWSFNGMSGPFAFKQYGDWHGRLTDDQLSDWLPLLTFYLVLDFVFIAVYTLALLRLAPKGSWARRAVWVLAALDVLENLGTYWLGSERCGDGDCVAGSHAALVMVITSLKWCAVVAVIVVLIVRHSQAVEKYFPRVRRALWIQRFSLLAFLPIALLTVVPGTDVLDQLPDVQRRWLDSGTGVKHAILAGFVYYAVLLPAIFLLGRMRGDWALRRVRGEQHHWPFYDNQGKPRRQKLGLWVIGPILLPVTAIVIALTKQGEVFERRLVVFCLIPLVIWVVSWRLRDKANIHPKDLRTVQPWFPGDVMAAGDILTVAALSFAGLGMVRAFAALAFGDAVGLFSASYTVGPGVALLVGVLLAIAPWIVAWPVLKAISEWAKPGTTGIRGWYGRLATPGVNKDGQIDVDTDPRRWTRIAFIGAATAGILVLSLFPRRFADALGVLAATMLALTTLVVLVGVTVAYAQERQPPEIFQIGRTRQRATPIITLLVFAVVMTSLIGGKTEVHPVTADTATAVPTRPTMQQAFDSWLAQSSSCTVKDDTGLTLRPMLLVAAEGGGIRATYWTAAALEKLGTAGDGCAKKSVLFSGGASGGAFALSIARFTDQPLSAVKSISGHQALGAATISLLSGDLVASVTGLRFDAASEYRTPARQPLDRAGLMETAWERKIPAARTLFLPEATGGSSMTGQLILTSTAVRNGCRALVSQVDLSEGAQTAGGSPVCGSGVAGAHAYDLFGAFGPTADRKGRGCVGNLQALTGGLLASRFPYVTPSGVVGPCGDLKAAQLVDGGYTDNTGLGTIVDLESQWGEPVRQHNDQVLADGKGEIVVPLVVYIENGTGKDYSVPDDRPVAGIGNTFKSGTTLSSVPELLVPPVTKLLTAKGDSTDARALLQDANGAARAKLCTTSAKCDQLRKDPRLMNAVFVINQSTQPSLSAPLGWTLSQASQNDLDNDLQLQNDRSCGPTCPGYGTLRDLFSALGMSTS